MTSTTETAVSIPVSPLASRAFMAASEAFYAARRSFRAVGAALIAEHIPVSVDAAVFAMVVSDDEEQLRFVGFLIEGKIVDGDEFDTQHGTRFRDVFDQIMVELAYTSYHDAKMAFQRTPDLENFLVHRAAE